MAVVYRDFDGVRTSSIIDFIHTLTAVPTVEGEFGYRAASNRLECFDGTTAQTVAWLSDLTGLGRYQGNYDASTDGTLPSANNHPDIEAGDYWRVTTGGTQTGLIGEDVLTPGDVIFADVNAATTAGQFYALEGNANLASNLVVGEEVGPINLVANTGVAFNAATFVGGTLLTWEPVDGAGNSLKALLDEAETAGPGVTLTANQAIANVTVKMVGLPA